jgi:1-deoxy-D-xylulose-5-phosphate reductoisomerase
MAKVISILGSTGSVGVSSLKIIEKRKNIFKINLLSANKNYNLICHQIQKYKPAFFLIFDKKIFEKVKKNVKIINSLDEKYFIKKSDITISAITGIAGLKPTIYFIKKSKKILIANKESIVCGWELIRSYLKKFKTKLISIDSEHYSIMKLMEGYKLNEIKKIYITASGGPFLNYKYNRLKKIKPHEALKHPKWRMGKKISIDSATLMNKIFEIVEAQKLFSIPNEKLDILIHPNSLVHAIIHLKNGLIKFLYHETSMMIPLANAIFDGNLNIEKFFKSPKNSKSIIAELLVFKKVDEKKFPLIKLKNKITEYPSTAIIINAANEVLVSEFY